MNAFGKIDFFPEQSGVSVCLLTYNHAHLVKEVVESILAQTYQNFELVISDDCSTDDTWDRIQKLAKCDARIRPVRTPRNLGMPGNASFAVEQSVKPYVALLHHDDYYHPELLEKWVAVLDSYPSIGFVFNDYQYENGRVRGLILGPNPLDGKTFLEEQMFSSWGSPVRGTAMVRRNCWNAVGGMQERFNLLADVDLWMRLAARFSVGYVPEALITVRQQRPAGYPETYGTSGWSWERQRYLYDIYAENLIKLYSGTPFSRLRQIWFLIRLNSDQIKWISYAILRKRKDMLMRAGEGATEYDWFLVKIYRWVAQHVGTFMLSPR